MIRRCHRTLACHSSSRAIACCPGAAAAGAASLAAVSRSAGAMTRLPHGVTSTWASPAALAVAAICPAVMAMAGRSPNNRSWVRPASSSTGLFGQRSTEMSEMLSTPPGRRTRWHSAKNSRRERKWNAASTLMMPSTDRSPNGNCTASAATAAAEASRSLSRPASSCQWVIFTATSRRGRTVAATSGSAVPSPFPTSRTTPPTGSAAARVATRRRQASAAWSSDPGPSHSPRFSQPGATSRKESDPMLS